MPQAPDNSSDISLDELARFVAELPVALALFDRDQRYRAASGAWIAAFGLSRGPLTGHRHAELSRTGAQALDELLRRALSGEAVEDQRIVEEDPPYRWWSLLSARPHRDADGTIVGAVLALRQAQFGSTGDDSDTGPDPLTGLAGRGEFVRQLRRLLAEPAGERPAALVLAVNLADFHDINTLFGNTIGDQVLRVTAARLVSGTRARRRDERRDPEAQRATDGGGPDLVARLGADEFGILCGSGPLSLADAEALATRLVRAVSGTVAVEGRSVRPAATAGFLIPAATHADADDVLRDLDLASHQAKAAGPGAAVGWQPSLTVAAIRRSTLAMRLRQAYDEAEFVVHYQPVLRLADNCLVGAEALLRWNKPGEGLLPQAAFAAALDEGGLAVEVGAWVVREVVRQMETWETLYGRHIVDWVSIRLMRRQLAAPAKLLATLEAVDRSGFALRHLMLGVGDAALEREAESAGRLLDEARRLGLRIALDAFGTGPVWPEPARAGPVDAVIIDAGFIAGIGTEEGERLLQALLAIARLHGGLIIGDGIETPAQSDFLREHGCGCGAGGLLATAMDGALLGAFALTHPGTRPGDGGRGSGPTRLVG
ncbi:MAG: EAL domain-containing protein [Thiohalocapsa sp.]